MSSRSRADDVSWNANAAEESVEDFARRCRELARRVQADEGVAEFEAQRKSCRMRRRVDRDTGMYHFHLELDPVAGSTVSSAYLAHLASVRARHCDDDMTHERLAATAMVELKQKKVCRFRRRQCDGCAATPTIGRAILNAKGELLDLGRSQRTANRAQRRALKAMYRTCGHPDCQVLLGDCQIHHVIWWERFGLTDLDNLIPLCSPHHPMVHEGGWTLTLDADRVITLHRPDGTLSFRGSTIDRAPHWRVRSDAPTTTNRRLMRAAEMMRDHRSPSCASRTQIASPRDDHCHPRRHRPARLGGVAVA